VDVPSTVALADIGSGDLMTPLLFGRLRSAGAIHLATAWRGDAHAKVAYRQDLPTPPIAVPLSSLP
jgi:hypothetical protein